ncbi:hypothetical protein [uncultured Alistipes sp.]|uniref:hypothetical protein n=1 Tax=uncultured Alistipes sp. TaxID=538949 RepID=UPI00265E4065|nr:hypothetical protein [uncultured Alistipes sp.]
MKKYLTLAIALFAAVALQSCKDDNTDEPNPGLDPEPTVEYDVDTVSSICEGIYFGDAYLANEDVYTYYVNISDKPVTEAGYTDSEGTYYILWLNTPLEEQIANGTYTLTEETNKYTEYSFLGGEFSYIVHKNQQYFIKEGTMTVTTNGIKPRIEIEMTTTEGTTFHTVYEGIYFYYNKSIEWLKQDMNTTMTCAYSWYLTTASGESYDNKANLNITLYEKLDEDNWLVPPSSVLVFVGRGEFDNDGNLIPGTFTITNDEEASDYTFLAGGCINFMNAPFPSSTNLKYYYDPDNTTAIQVGLAQSGTVEIEKNGDNYTLTYDLTTDKGKKMTGSYTGPIVVQDAPKVIEKNEWDLPEDLEMTFDAQNIKTQVMGSKYTVSDAYTWQFQFLQYNENWRYAGDQLYIEIVNNLDETEEPVPGVYKISDSNEVGTARMGTYKRDTGVDGFGTGTYFKHYDEGTLRWAGAATDGEVEVTKNDDGTYTITFDFLDGQEEPKHFKGTWTGELTRPW